MKLFLMANHNGWEERLEKEHRQKERHKKTKMKVSGKAVFGLKKIIVRKVG